MEGQKLFKVGVRFMDPHLSMLLTHGGTSGGVHESEVFVPADSREQAITTAWEGFLQKAEEQTTRNGELLLKRRQGTLARHEELLISSVRTPVQKDQWRADEVTIKGYKVVCLKLEPEVPKVHKPAEPECDICGGKCIGADA